MKTEKYTVQFVIVKEFEVRATDDIQASKLAYQQLGGDKYNAIGFKVMEPEDGSGGLDEDLMKSMEFIRKKVETIDPDSL